MSKLIYFFTLLVAINTSDLYAQLNLKVGYKNGITSAPELNNIIENYHNNFKLNNPTGRIDAAMEPFKVLHGIELGMRYRMRSVGAEISYSNINARKDVFLTLPNNVAFSDRRFMIMSEVSLGLENYFGVFGYGASFDFRRVKTSTPITGSKRKTRSTSEEQGTAGKFYLIFQFPGEKVGIAFKPYVQFPLSTYDLSSFDQDLNVKLNPEYKAPKPQEERFFMYGITVALYNGKQ